MGEERCASIGEAHLKGSFLQERGIEEGKRVWECIKGVGRDREEEADKMHI